MARRIDRPSNRQGSDVDFQSAIVRRWCDGQTQGEIVTELGKLGVTVDPETVREVTRKARRNGWLRFMPPADERAKLQIEKLHEKHRLVVRVVPTLEASDIAAEGARLLCDILQELRSHGRDEVHIGWLGGRTPMLLAVSLAKIFADISAWQMSPRNFPSKITFHSLIGNMLSDDPNIDPNAYFTHFTSAAHQIDDHFRLKFRSLPAPGVVLLAQYDILNQFALIRSALDKPSKLEQLDVIVTSCGHWSNDSKNHFSAGDHMSAACGDVKELAGAWESTKELIDGSGVIGDFAWCPMSTAGPIDVAKAPIQLVKVLDVEDLCRFVVRGREQPSGRRGVVLLLAGPCGGCDRSKGDLLHSVLDSPGLGATFESPPVTHLVLDRRTADQYLRTRDGRASAPGQHIQVDDTPERPRR